MLVSNLYCSHVAGMLSVLTRRQNGRKWEDMENAAVVGGTLLMIPFCLMKHLDSKCLAKGKYFYFELFL